MRTVARIMDGWRMVAETILDGGGNDTGRMAVAATIMDGNNGWRRRQRRSWMAMAVAVAMATIMDGDTGWRR